MIFGIRILTIFLLACGNAVCLIVKNDLMAVLIDFIKMQKDPTHVTIFHCWRKSDVLTFLKTVSKTHRVRLQNTNLGRLSYLQPEEYQLILLNLNCIGSQKLLQQSQDLKMFAASFRWLLWGSNFTFNLFEFDFTLNSRIFRITPIENDYKITSLYKVNNNTMENVIASWTTDRQGFTHLNEFSIGRNRSNLMRRKITVCGVFAHDVNSDKHIWDYKDREKDTITKITYVLMYHIVEMLNGTPNALSTNTWGYKLANETRYNGMVGELQSRNAEIAGTPMFLTHERLKIVDFITTSSKAQVKFIFRKPPLSYTVNVYVHPFTNGVWIAYFCVLTLIFVMIYFIVKWEERTPEVSEVKKSNTPVWHQPNIVDVVLLEISVTSQQGSEFEMLSLSGRIAMFFLHIILLFLYTAYSANIVVLLQATCNNIQTPTDLFNSRIKLSAEDIPFNRHFLLEEREKNPLWASIYDRKMAGDTAFFVPLGKGIEKIRTEYYAIHTENQQAYTLIGKTFYENEKCGLSEIDFLNRGSPFIAMRKNSTIKELMKIKFQQVHESGISKCQLHRFFDEKPKCLGRTSNFVSVDLYDCYTAFLLYGAGVLISFCLLILECFYSKYGAVIRCPASVAKPFPFVN